MAKLNADGRPKRRVLPMILALLLVAVVAYGAWFGLSVQRVRTLIGDAQQSYAAMQKDIEAQDYDAALKDARAAATTAGQLESELDGVQWDVAAVLPVLGTDVSVARTLGDVSASFSNDAVIPVLDAWDTLMASGVITDGSFNVQALGAKADQLSSLVHALEDAGAVSSTCINNLDNLPTAHFDELNQAAEKLRSAVSSADEALDSMSGALTVAAGISDLVSGLLNP